MYRWAASSAPNGTFTNAASQMGAPVADRYPFVLMLPLAPYRFVLRDEPAVDAH